MNFLQPIFFGALLATAVPILIHLSQRRKFKDFNIGTLRFLKLAEKKRNLRLRIEQWPLLLLRILALVLLAFLFARPFFLDREKLIIAQDKTIILLDASGSMTPGMEDEAKDAAVQYFTKENGATLAQFTDDVRVLSSIDQYAPIAGAPSDFNRALAWTLDHLRSQGIENAKVVLIGHFAASQMPSAPPRVWPPRVRVETIAINPPEDQNNAVRALELLTPFATQAMEIEARLTASTKPREVRLSAEGLNLKQTVPPGVERVLFSFRPPREEVRGSVSIDGKDAWPADDKRPFSMRWVEPEPVMIVDGFPGSTPFEGQGYFLQKALAASGAAHGLSPFRPEISFGLDAVRDVETGETTGPKDLAKFSAFTLCGPIAVSAVEAKMLSDAVARGAGLLIVLDGRWTPEATEALERVGLFPPGVQFSGGIQQRRIASWDESDPLFSEFNGNEGGDLRSLVWRDSFTVQPSENWKPLATLDGGHPILVELKNDDPKRGRVIVLPHPLTREWTDLPREPIFVPFVKSIFKTLTRYEPRQNAALVRTPGAHESRAIGFYTNADGTAEVVAADPAESSVAAVDAGAFRKAFALPDATAESMGSEIPPNEIRGEERPRDGEWWPWAAMGLFLILTLECALATRRSAIAEPPTFADA